MSRVEIRPIARTVVVVVAVLAVAAGLTWWALAHREEQDSEVRQPAIGARLATPGLVWPDGLPDGDTEDSPWVQTVRDWNLAYSVAFNARDFSDATFAALTTEDLRQTYAQHMLDDVDTGQFPTWYRFGPTPMTITDVTIDDDATRATVTACEYTLSWSALTADEAERALQASTMYSHGQLVEYQLEKQPDGTLVVTHYGKSGGLTQHCTLDGVKRALFDPAPPYGTVTQPEDVIGADGEPLVDPTDDPTVPAS